MSENSDKVGSINHNGEVLMILVKELVVLSVKVKKSFMLDRMLYSQID